jgi:hypothetical protein
MPTTKQLLSKVPEVTVFFQTIKILATPRPGLRPEAVALRAVSPHVSGVVTRLSGCPKTSSAFGIRIW